MVDRMHFAERGAWGLEESTFLWFGLGFGLPLLALSFLSGASQRWITRQFAQRARLINVVGGVLLVVVGVYDLWSNWGGDCTESGDRMRRLRDPAGAAICRRLYPACSRR